MMLHQAKFAWERRQLNNPKYLEEILLKDFGISGDNEFIMQQDLVVKGLAPFKGKNYEGEFGFLNEILATSWPKIYDSENRATMQEIVSYSLRIVTYVIRSIEINVVSESSVEERKVSVAILREDMVADAVLFLKDPLIANKSLKEKVAFLTGKSVTLPEISAAFIRTGLNLSPEELKKAGRKLREDLLGNGVQFLLNKKTDSLTHDNKVAFLKGKGLSQDEIEESFERSGKNFKEEEEKQRQSKLQLEIRTTKGASSFLEQLKISALTNKTVVGELDFQDNLRFLQFDKNVWINYWVTMLLNNTKDSGSGGDVHNSNNKQQQERLEVFRRYPKFLIELFTKQGRNPHEIAELFAKVEEKFPSSSPKVAAAALNTQSSSLLDGNSTANGGGGGQASDIAGRPPIMGKAGVNVAIPSTSSFSGKDSKITTTTNNLPTGSLYGGGKISSKPTMQLMTAVRFLEREKAVLSSPEELKLFLKEKQNLSEEDIEEAFEISQVRKRDLGDERRKLVNAAIRFLNTPEAKAISRAKVVEYLSVKRSMSLQDIELAARIAQVTLDDKALPVSSSEERIQQFVLFLLNKSSSVLPVEDRLVFLRKKQNASEDELVFACSRAGLEYSTSSLSSLSAQDPRKALLTQARIFLNNPKAKAMSYQEQSTFLSQKGLTSQEIANLLGESSSSSLSSDLRSGIKMNSTAAGSIIGLHSTVDATTTTSDDATDKKKPVSILSMEEFSNKCRDYLEMTCREVMKLLRSLLAKVASTSPSSQLSEIDDEILVRCMLFLTVAGRQFSFCKGRLGIISDIHSLLEDSFLFRKTLKSNPNVTVVGEAFPVKQSNNPLRLALLGDTLELACSVREAVNCGIDRLRTFVETEVGYSFNEEFIKVEDVLVKRFTVRNYIIRCEQWMITTASALLVDHQSSTSTNGANTRTVQQRSKQFLSVSDGLDISRCFHGHFCSRASLVEYNHINKVAYNYCMEELRKFVLNPAVSTAKSTLTNSSSSSSSDVSFTIPYIIGGLLKGWMDYGSGLGNGETNVAKLLQDQIVSLSSKFVSNSDDYLANFSVVKNFSVEGEEEGDFERSIRVAYGFAVYYSYSTFASSIYTILPMILVALFDGSLYCEGLFAVSSGTSLKNRGKECSKFLDSSEFKLATSILATCVSFIQKIPGGGTSSTTNTFKQKSENELLKWLQNRLLISSKRNYNQLLEIRSISVDFCKLLHDATLQNGGGQAKVTGEGVDGIQKILQAQFLSSCVLLNACSNKWQDVDQVVSAIDVLARQSIGYLDSSEWKRILELACIQLDFLGDNNKKNSMIYDLLVANLLQDIVSDNLRNFVIHSDEVDNGEKKKFMNKHEATKGKQSRVIEINTTTVDKKDLTWLSSCRLDFVLSIFGEKYLFPVSLWRRQQAAAALDLIFLESMLWGIRHGRKSLNHRSLLWVTKLVDVKEDVATSSGVISGNANKTALSSSNSSRTNVSIWNNTISEYLPSWNSKKKEDEVEATGFNDHEFENDPELLLKFAPQGLVVTPGLVKVVLVSMPDTTTPQTAAYVVGLVMKRFSSDPRVESQSFALTCFKIIIANAKTQLLELDRVGRTKSEVSDLVLSLVFASLRAVPLPVLPLCLHSLKILILEFPRIRRGFFDSIARCNDSPRRARLTFFYINEIQPNVISRSKL